MAMNFGRRLFNPLQVQGPKAILRRTQKLPRQLEAKFRPPWPGEDTAHLPSSPPTCSRFCSTSGVLTISALFLNLVISAPFISVMVMFGYIKASVYCLILMGFSCNFFLFYTCCINQTTISTCHFATSA